MDGYPFERGEVPDMRKQMVLTAVGRDRPGIVEEFTKLILHYDGNIEASRMVRLGRHELTDVETVVAQKPDAALFGLQLQHVAALVDQRGKRERSRRLREWNVKSGKRLLPWLKWKRSDGCDRWRKPRRKLKR